VTLQCGVSLTDDTSIVIYNCIVFMMQATDLLTDSLFKLTSVESDTISDGEFFAAIESDVVIFNNFDVD
jgi:hypothetical protein